ncbi:hypothetical protein [Halorubrum halodurans]|uniref:hypothetical protein n=1 Tax=Halorubrum halodurans TaxID=1383851 RepID=UPI00117AC3B0|nr:hypothetical protein [Halorubrum halodurans]
MPLTPGEKWSGLDTLRIVDEARGKVVLDGLMITGMDIDPSHNRVTMMVSSDIGHDGTHEVTHEKPNDD